MNSDQALLLGIDLGTTATKAALYRLDGSLVGEGRASVEMAHPAPGCVEQSMTDFYDSAAEATRNCLSNSGADPRAVVLSTVKWQESERWMIDSGRPCISILGSTCAANPISKSW